MKYYIKDDLNGPYYEEQLEAWVVEGKLLPDVLVSDGEGEWISLRDVLNLSPIAPAPISENSSPITPAHVVEKSGLAKWLGGVVAALLVGGSAFFAGKGFVDQPVETPKPEVTVSEVTEKEEPEVPKEPETPEVPEAPEERKLSEIPTEEFALMWIEMQAEAERRREEAEALAAITAVVKEAGASEVQESLDALDEPSEPEIEIGAIDSENVVDSKTLARAATLLMKSTDKKFEEPVLTELIEREANFYMLRAVSQDKKYYIVVVRHDGGTRFNYVEGFFLSEVSEKEYNELPDWKKQHIQFVNDWPGVTKDAKPPTAKVEQPKPEKQVAVAPEPKPKTSTRRPA